MGEEEWDGCRDGPTLSDEVDAQRSVSVDVDLGAIVWELVEHGFALAPVEHILRDSDQALHVRQRCSHLPADILELVRERSCSKISHGARDSAVWDSDLVSFYHVL